MMNYPNYFNYQNYQQPQYQQQLNAYQQAPQQPQDERIFVQGEIAAQAYLVAPNSFVRLWDSTDSVFYEKRADAAGRPYMESFEYKRRNAQNVAQASQNTGQAIDYMDRIKALEARIEALEGGKKNDAEQ